MGRFSGAAIAEHSNLTTGIHGIAGNVVGTIDTQTITNKTVVAANNTISGLLHGNQVDNPSIAHGATGAIVGTTNSQTLTNKTIVAANNTISGLLHGNQVDNPSLAHGATGAVVGTTNVQTLTGKTLSFPKIATISNTGNITVPTTTGRLTLWDADNPIIFRSYSVGYIEIVFQALTTAKASNWIWDTVNDWADSSTDVLSYIPLKLSDGAKLTTLGSRHERATSATAIIRFIKVNKSTGARSTIATHSWSATTMAVSSVTLSDYIVNNNIEDYYLELDHNGTANEIRYQFIVIDFDVVRPNLG